MGGWVGCVSIPKRVSEVLWLRSLMGRTRSISVSIPKRVSEVLWLLSILKVIITNLLFQSLKGFQRFCGLQSSLRAYSEVLFQSLKGFQRFCG